MPTGNTQQIIDYGASANDGTGDPLRTAFIKTDENFDNIWLAGPVGSNVRINNNTISVLDTNGNLVLSPNGVGIIQTNNHLVPRANKTYDIGSANLQYRTVYANTATFQTLSINSDLTVLGNLTVAGDTVEMGNIVADALTLQLANTATTNAQANGAGVTVGANDDIATLLYDSVNNVWETNIGVGVSGNVTANYFVGNGSQLTNIDANSINGLATVAFTGEYGDLANVPTIPTQTSQLTNDSGFITSAAIPSNVSAFNNDAGYITVASANVVSVNGQTGVVSLSIPTATSNLINDSGFITAANVPTNVSSFNNDAGYITTSTANVISVNGQTGVVTLIIPTATSNLTNDSGFITTANLSTLSLDVITTGNISGTYILGNGSQLTGLPASYSDANVVLLLANFGSNSISTTGNIIAGNVIGNISITGNITGTQSNVDIVAGNYTWTFNNAGNLVLPGNTFAVNYANGTQVVFGGSYDNSNVVALLSSFGSNTISTTGSVTAGNIIGGNITGNTSGFAIGYRDIPQVLLSANATITTSDAGKHYYANSVGTLSWTIANNASQAFQIGATINIINKGTGNVNILQGIGVSMYLAGNATTSNRVLTSYGVASITKVETDTWFISGVGLI